MNPLLKRHWPALALLAGWLVLGSVLVPFQPWRFLYGPVREENCNRIRLGMTGPEVLAILGEPTEGVVPTEEGQRAKGDWAMWHRNRIVMQVWFKEGRVVDKGYYPN